MQFGIRNLLFLTSLLAIWLAFAHYLGAILILTLGAPLAALTWDVWLGELETNRRRKR